MRKTHIHTHKHTICQHLYFFRWCIIFYKRKTTRGKYGDEKLRAALGAVRQAQSLNAANKNMEFHVAL